MPDAPAAPAVSPPSARSAVALAAAVAAVVFVASYAVQRLAAGPASLDPPVVQLVRIPFYWRCALALVQAVVAGALVGFGVRPHQAEAALRWAPVWVPLVALPAAVAALAMP